MDPDVSLGLDKAQSSDDEAVKTKRTHPAAVVALGLVLVIVIVVLGRSWPLASKYVDSPSGSLQTEYGTVPDVVGMRADAAASALAQGGY